MLKAVNIEWEVDSKEDLDYLPSEIIIPEEYEKNDTDMIEEISDYISNETGFCHNGFELVPLKEIGQVSFAIEHYNGEDYMSFILSIKENGKVEVIQTKDCSVADRDGDYIFDTDNDLFRIQAETVISEADIERNKASYE